VSVLDPEPIEQVCEATDAGAAIEVLEPRDVPLGGPRAMGVRRTLPQRSRSLIGAWCFADHYGPERTRMTVPPHPHTGLQTVSWLFAGEIEHRDSVGSHALVRPGEVNLMTAGAGIQHSEDSTAASEVLHGVQLWVALPDAARHRAPLFEHAAIEPVPLGEATVHVFVGSMLGSTSPVAVFSDLLGAQVDVPAGVSVEVPLDPEFEHGLLVDDGDVTIDGVVVARSQLAFLPTGRSSVVVSAASAARLILLGGRPFGERIVMWWNFVGRSHDEIVEYRARWMSEVVDGQDAAGRFGSIGTDRTPLAAPELPSVRLKPRE
jgi:redox-sensitive bicupin YhaK (pirin superfamily)